MYTLVEVQLKGGRKGNGSSQPAKWASVYFIVQFSLQYSAVNGILYIVLFSTTKVCGVSIHSLGSHQLGPTGRSWS